MCISTRLILSNTHGLRLKAGAWPAPQADVAIHCDGLTRHSTLAEMWRAMALLKRIDAPLKLVIAGGDDISLDIPAFLNKKLSEAARLTGELLDSSDVKAEFGDHGEARKLFKKAQADGIRLLDQGSHRFRLGNGARLQVFASRWTPADVARGSHGAFQHAGARGIMDMTAERLRVGCRQLFAAVAGAQPRVHCFGRVHGGWGARLAQWRRRTRRRGSRARWAMVESLATLAAATRAERRQRHELERCRRARPLLGKGRTLQGGDGEDGELSQLPWLVELGLPAADGPQPEPGPGREAGG